MEIVRGGPKFYTDTHTQTHTHRHTQTHTHTPAAYLISLFFFFQKRNKTKKSAGSVKITPNVEDVKEEKLLKISKN